MDKTIFLLFLISVSFAVPTCPAYPYHDYVSANSYSAPIAPPDTLLHYCDWNFSEICLLSNAFNTTQDKKLFIAESIANDSFNQIWQWNSNINFGRYPPNTSTSSTNIKDAWVSIAYLNPSIYDNGTYLINASTHPLIEHNFTFVVNTNRLSGDCNDNFRICGYSYSISLLNTSSSITANMNVRSQYLVDRSHLVTHCDMTGCWVSCDYYRTDNFPNSLTVSDSKNIQLLTFNSTSNYTLLSYFNDLAGIQINATDPNVLFQIGNSTFYKSDYVYSIRNESGNYNVLVKEITPENRTLVYGMSILNQSNSSFTLLAPYSENCSLTAWNSFSQNTISGCNGSNVSTNFTAPEIPVVTPPFFVSLFDAALLGIVVYIVYLIIKKVMSHD